MEQPAAPDSKRDRLISALLLFLPLALWPAAAAVSSWSEGAIPSFVLALVGVVLAAVPAVATALGFGWSRKLAEAFALGGMVIGILYVLRNGITLFAVPIVGYFVVYAFLTHERFRASGPKPAKPAEPPPPEHPLAWLKENVEAIAVAFIMALVIRCFCVEVFKIPSSSMEPTLLGDSPPEGRGGDRIMVTKLTYGVQDVRRFEPVVFKFPLNPMKNYIKRVVGLPNERFVLYNGNVYAAPGLTGEAVYRIQRKSLRVQRSIWIRSWTRDDRPLLQSKDHFEAHFPESRGAFTLRDGTLSGGPGSVSWTATRIDDTHLGGMGAGRATVNDILFEADLALQKGDGRFWIRIDHDFGPFELKLGPSGGSELTWGKNKKSIPLATPAFPVGKTVRVEFMVFDGQAFVLFDGRVQAELVFQETLDEAEGLASRHGLSFGAEGIPFSLAKLRVAQDIHYKPKDEGQGWSLSRRYPLNILPGCYFMLGDNVNNSHDGRAWKKYTVKLTDGRVIEYESQAKVTRSEAKQAWAKRHGQEGEPYLYIESDINGHEQGIYFKQIAPDGETDDYAPFVEGRFIIGRAFAVCWPLSRSLRMIR